MNNILISENVHLNEQHNGKIEKYLDNGILVFEGEYLNGKKNGKCKQYNYNGKLNLKVNI